jgi:hypothetical protein
MDGSRRGPARCPGASALGRCRPALPRLRQLHPGLPDLLLQYFTTRMLIRSASTHAPAALGFLLYRRAFLYRRRRCAHERPSRYRQWLTHKLASWEQQFDVRAAPAVAVVSAGARWVSISPLKPRACGSPRETIADEMLEHPFFHELSEDYVQLMGDCGENVDLSGRCTDGR